MTTDSMVEKMARAMAEDMQRQLDAKPIPGDPPGHSWTASGGVIDMVQVARAGMLAMRKLNSPMAGAGYRALMEYPIDDELHAMGVIDFRANAIWRAMIDAALKEGE